MFLGFGFLTEHIFAPAVQSPGERDVKVCSSLHRSMEGGMAHVCCAPRLAGDRTGGSKTRSPIGNRNLESPPY